MGCFFKNKKANFQGKLAQAQKSRFCVSKSGETKNKNFWLFPIIVIIQEAQGDPRFQSGEELGPVFL